MLIHFSVNICSFNTLNIISLPTALIFLVFCVELVWLCVNISNTLTFALLVIGVLIGLAAELSVDVIVKSVSGCARIFSHPQMTFDLSRKQQGMKCAGGGEVVLATRVKAGAVYWGFLSHYEGSGAPPDG